MVDAQWNKEIAQDRRVATAVIVDVERFVRGGPVVTVRFTTGAGQSITSVLPDNYTSTPDRGELVPVEYSAKDPGHSVRVPPERDNVQNEVLLALGLAGVGVLAIVLREPALKLAERWNE